MHRKKLSDRIAADIKKRIVKGEFLLNEKLPSERLLAEHYGVSRIPVREAVQILTEEGILEKKVSSGSIIISVPSGDLLYPAEESAFSTDNKLLTETLRLRRLIESEAAREAAIHADAEGIERIQRALFKSISEIRKLKLGETHRFYEADQEFHYAIAAESGNPFFTRCLDAIPSVLNAHQHFSLASTEQKDDVIPYHTLIFESILDHDPERAYDAMSRHLSRVEELMESENK